MAATVPKVQALSCPSCGGIIQLRGYGQAVNAVCIQCLSVLDARTPSLQILQRFQSAERYQPLIPLGTRGKLESTAYEAIGFQVRGIEVDGVRYQWSEYLLFNPYKGYRYLTEYQGHWNDIQTLRTLPIAGSAAGKKTVVAGGRTYAHFQNAEATTHYVMGEFPWQVRVGEKVITDDYISPPGVVSSETTEEEVVWSIGKYTPAKAIWEAFQLKGSPPAPVGVYANQPSPHKAKVASSWLTFFLLLALLFTAVIVTWLASANRKVFEQIYRYDTPVPGEKSFVTPVFEVPGNTSNVKVEIQSNLMNDWAFFSMALINDETGVAYDFGKEVSFFAGGDVGGGSWSEGKRNGSVTIPSVKAGRYYLRIEPEMESDQRWHSVDYKVVVSRGVPGIGWFLVALALLPLPAIITTWRSFQFENTRWAESDYGSGYSSITSYEEDD